MMKHITMLRLMIATALVSLFSAPAMAEPSALETALDGMGTSFGAAVLQLIEFTTGFIDDNLGLIILTTAIGFALALWRKFTKPRF